MAEMAKHHHARLKELKDNVVESYQYFEPNFKRYNDFMRFVFSTALTNDAVAKLQTLQKPTIEFGSLETYVSHQRGEFAEHEPGLSVSLADGVLPEDVTPELVKEIEVVEAHTRETIESAENDGFQDDVYDDLLSGGFSVAKVYTDYINELSFEQKICIERVFDPCLTGFDPLARKSHKGDGQYCYEVIPMVKEEFEQIYGDKMGDGMQYTRSIAGFNWSYQNSNKKIVLVCVYYEKQRKKARIVKLSNGKTILKKHYQQLQDIWDESGAIEQMPVILEERNTMLEVICRYHFCENRVLKYEETDYTFLPLVFIDGNSKMLRDNMNSSTQQMTRPYVYQAKGMQELKNFCGQTIGAEIENMVQHKFVAAAESIPEDYRDAYTNVQQAQVLVYNAFYKGNPESPLPPPREVQRTPMPDIVSQIFLGSDQVIQSLLGSYDAQMGIVGNEISGKAIQQGAMHSSAAAKPYLIGYIKGLNRIAQIILDLIPKYYVTPRSIPVRRSDGRRDYQIINSPSDPKSIKITYRPNDLQVKIEAGVNTATQKQIALDQTIRMMGASEGFSAFINQKGLPWLLQNMDIRGVEELSLAADDFMKQAQEAQQAASQKPDPTEMLVQAEKEVELAKVEQRREQSTGELAIKTSQLAIDKQKADLEFMKLLAEVEQLDSKNLRETQRLDADLARDAIETVMAVSKHHTETSRHLYEEDRYGGSE